MKRGTPDHPKMLDLAESIHLHLNDLDIDLPYEACEALACGLIERLHHYAARYSPAGDVGKHSNVRIARAIGWAWDADWLINTMASDTHRWLDQMDGESRLYIHDWHDHSDEVADRYLADNGLRYANNAPPRNKPRKGSKAWKPDGSENRLPHADARGRTRTHAADSNPHANACKSESESQPESEPKSKSEPEPPPSPEPHADAASAAEGGGGLVEVSWGQVEARLIHRGVACWRESSKEAKACKCTPDLAMKLLDYADEHKLGNGAVVFRFARASPQVEVFRGWPEPDKEVQNHDARVERKERRAIEQQRSAQATQIVKNGRKAKKTDDEIREQLRLAGLDWPSY